ncbi:MAG: FkbM family methyltransferase [Gammaproteobacteria bacterium]|nr:FkbM family methyltransferase [Gammaproteobacteria bacterium]
MSSVRALKNTVLEVPWIGAVAQSIWRCFKDPYLDPIGRKIADRFSKWQKLTIVQIGANDGTRFDPIHVLLKNRHRWAALFVEPIPMVYEKLVENYGRSSRFKFECSAVSDVAGSFSFYHLSPEARSVARQWHEYFDLVGSLDRAHVVKALADEAENLDKYILETKVPVITLKMLLDKWGVDQIDVLVVDAEGYDWKIVTQAIEMGLRPEVILFEHSNLNPEEKSDVFRLLESDYHVDDVGIDFLCMSREAK